MKINIAAMVTGNLHKDNNGINNQNDDEDEPMDMTSSTDDNPNSVNRRQIIIRGLHGQMGSTAVTGHSLLASNAKSVQVRSRLPYWHAINAGSLLPFTAHMPKPEIFTIAQITQLQSPGADEGIEDLSVGTKDDDEDEDDDDCDKFDSQKYDPERLKAFNVRFIPLHLSSNE